MKISTLIEKLQELQKIYGDVTVVVEDKNEEPEGNLPIKSVVFDDTEYRLFNVKEVVLKS